ncbi:MAG TPA: glycosyltransferase [Patescibacteria group bacterium]|nr:glycosyltransferase [Patescibacteria group bacterium]
MKIGIDISQLAYQNTGVANYLSRLVEHLLKIDQDNEYVLFFSSLRKNFQFSIFNFQSNANVSIKQFRFPPTLLDVLWNRLHVLPIETLIGDVDVFISSDWTEPPTKKAKKMTILYDLIVYKAPEETAAKIVQTQKRKLSWTKKECAAILCISESTKRDAMEILGIQEDRLHVAYPGL